MDSEPQTLRVVRSPEGVKLLDFGLLQAVSLKETDVTNALTRAATPIQVTGKFFP